MPDRVIADPILNGPYDEPALHFRFGDDGITDEVVKARRPSAYFVPVPRPRKRAAQLELPELTADQIEVNRQVNDVRERVALWRKDNYAGASPTSRRLLEHWATRSATPHPVLPARSRDRGLPDRGRGALRGDLDRHRARAAERRAQRRMRRCHSCKCVMSQSDAQLPQSTCRSGVWLARMISGVLEIRDNFHGLRRGVHRLGTSTGGAAGHRVRQARRRRQDGRRRTGRPALPVAEPRSPLKRGRPRPSPTGLGSVALSVLLAGWVGGPAFDM